MLSFIFVALALQSGQPNAKAGTPTPAPTVKTAAVKAAPTLFDQVLQRMTPVGQPIFRRYVDQMLQPRLRADRENDRQYRAALRALVAASALDVDAVERLIATRRQTEASMTTFIRTSAFTMIRALPVADRKLALTALFADTRLPANPPKPAAK